MKQEGCGGRAESALIGIEEEKTFTFACKYRVELLYKIKYPDSMLFCWVVIENYGVARSLCTQQMGFLESQAKLQ